MRSTTFILAACVPTASAYSLVDDYMENNYADFFDKFSFWTAKDTTKGFGVSSFSPVIDFQSKVGGADL
jgi:hypothetical protein